MKECADRRTDRQEHSTLYKFIFVVCNSGRKSRKLMLFLKVEDCIMKQISEVEEKPFTSSLSICPEACVLKRRVRAK